MDQLIEATPSFLPAYDDSEGYWKEYSELWDGPVDWEHIYGAPASSTPSESETSDLSSDTTLYEGSPTSALAPCRELEEPETSNDESDAMSLIEIEASLPPREDITSSLATIDAALMDQCTSPQPRAIHYTEICDRLGTLLKDNTDLRYSEQTQLIETLEILSFVAENFFKFKCISDCYLASEARFAVTNKALEIMTWDHTKLGYLMGLNYTARVARDEAFMKWLNFDQVMSAPEAQQTPSTLVEDSLNSRPSVTANAAPSQPAFVPTEQVLVMLNQRAYQAVPLGRTQSLPVFPSSASCASQAAARQPFRYPFVTTSNIYQIQE